jgi:competence protein ComEC
MDKWLLLFFLGAVFSLFLPIVPMLFYIVLLLAFVVVLIIRKNYAITGLLLGCCWILLQGYLYQTTLSRNNLAKNDLHHQHHIIAGEVVTLAIATTDHNKLSKQANSQRFNLKVTEFDYKKLAYPFTVRLSWKNVKFTAKQGNTIRVKVKLKPAHGLANIGAFNYQLWLRAKNIVATGYVVKSDDNKRLNNTLSFRQQQLEKITQILPQHSLSPLLIALVLGERSTISSSQWQILTATGTQHLIAISGLHLGLVAASVFIMMLLAFKVLPLGYLLPIGIKNRLNQYNLTYIAIALSLFVTFIYAMLAGFAIPTIRALFMLNIYWLARLLAINIALKRWLLLVVFFVLITSPMSILSASFWLSFYAVMVIFLLLWRGNDFFSSKTTLARSSTWRKKIVVRIVVFIKSLFILQLGLSIFLLPVTVLFYQKISLVAFAANIIAVPWMSFTAIPLSLFGMLVMPFSSHLAVMIFDLCLQSLQELWLWLSFLAQQSWALQLLSFSQSLIIAVVVFLLALVFFLDLSRRYYFYGIPVVLALLLNMLLADKTKWQVNVLDVGHGLAVVIEKNHHAIIYDTGAQYPSGFNISDAVTLPFLQQRGIKVIDMVFISHDDNDHLGGLDKLAAKISIKKIIYNKSFTHRNAFAKTVSQQACLQGQTLFWQALTIVQLWPKTKLAEHNDDSCVIRISDGLHSVLLTGDISKKVEKKLVQQSLVSDNDMIKSNVLIAPHHGSKSSSSILFLQTIQPQYVIFSSGYLNRWKMPVNSVLLNYRKLGIKTYTTADDGMIVVKMSANKLTFSGYRADLFPYWFAN